MDRTCRKGFTLVELAVSMVVIGILLGLGMSMVGPLMTSMKVRESRENLGAAVESVNSYASGNNRLPDSTTPPSSPTFWKNVAKTYTDAWGRDFIYLYDNNLYAAPSTKDTICGRRSTPITLRQCLTSNCSTTAGVDYIDVPNVAYILFSFADDATSNSKLNGTLTSASGTAALNNALITASGNITATAPATTATVTADTVNDLVRWVTLDELRTKVGCQGPQLKIVNNELPFGYATSPYNAIISADGGVPFASTGGKYRWCIQGASPGTATKPVLKSSDGTTTILYTSDCTNAAENLWTRGDYITLNLSVVVVNTKAYTCKTATSVSPPTTDWSEVGSTWVSGTNYSATTTVVSGTTAYTCKQSHTAVASNQPTSGANWRDYWTQTGTAWSAGSYTPPDPTYSFTVYVRDDNDTTGNNDNIASKTFVLTINPN
ncbi:prepilin-type N-terminal cleavage/methylation domain-containing protein [Trichlorobacter ammonificans]|uniref:Prepilin-type N-terminal cleavage/methylation domain-containing protein n=1 Tax=Trichlorobacter ammonificans TaxID=2916410 RepID=A0ABM9DAV4_9BACT|nr:prepilin-type N-terminal cleavage/methylation domain-containing protein [Trichlorobacter ammonificans]CAH2032368.1 protein of unknown function [Trichlorobacter ammonificans]